MVNKRKFEVLVAWIIVLAVIVSFIILKVRTADTFTYEGKKGIFKFDIEQIGSVTFFRPHVLYKGKEYIYAFRNKPQDLEDISLEEGIANKLNRLGGLKDLYITKDVNLSSQIQGSVSIVVAPMISILGRSDFGIYKARVTSAYTSHHAGEPVAPIVDCTTVNLNEKVNKTSGVILVRLGEDNRIYSDGDCVIVEGKDTDGLIKSGEKFGYHLIGVF